VLSYFNGYLGSFLTTKKNNLENKKQEEEDKMTYGELFEEVFKRCTGKTPGFRDFLCSSAIRQFFKDNPPQFRWAEATKEQKLIELLFVFFKEALQLTGMRYLDGIKERDEKLWANLTDILAVFRQILIEKFQVQLPEAKVVSPVEEMVEAGLLKETVGRNDKRFLSVNENYFDIKIRIIKEIPAGPAPEEFKKNWLKIPALPARRLQADLERPGYERGCYLVPKKEGLEAFRQVCPEGADWMTQYFDEFSPLVFGLDEAEIVSR